MEMTVWLLRSMEVVVGPRKGRYALIKVNYRYYHLTFLNVRPLDGLSEIT
jgi:hypothetical protein